MGFTKSEIEAIDTEHNLRPFLEAPRTKLDNNALELAAIDLSEFKEGEENLPQRLNLAKKLEKSVTTYGFFNLVNYGISSSEINHLRLISQSLLELPEEEKLKYLASAARKEDEKPGAIGGERGQGFKPKGYWAIKNGVRDSIDLYNVRNPYYDLFLEEREAHPLILQAHLDEVAHFYNHLHRVVLPKLLALCDLILGVKEGTLLNSYFHNSGTNEDNSGSHGRFMIYRPYENQELSKETDNTFLRGHSDISAFSFITLQPILALQIRDVYSGKWRYVQHREDSLIVNIGDALEFITGGYFKACTHRVIEPLPDQAQYNRLVVIYFCNPSEDAKLDPEQIKSKKLHDLGYTREIKLKNWDDISFKTWNNAKGQLLGRSNAGERNLLQVYGRAVERWHRLEFGSNY